MSKETKTPKPLAAVLAEARNKYTVHDCNECDYRKSCDLRFDCDECKTNRKSISLAFGIEDDYFTKLLDRIEAAAEREREEAKDYFAKLHDGPSMICTAKNCSLRNAAEDIVEQVKAEASFGHFAPVVVEDRPVGNAAAMREALERCNELFRCDDDNKLRLCHLARKADEATQAALAAPARNCDRFQTEREAFAFYIDHVPDNGNIMTGYPDWLFATKLVYGDAAGKGGAE